MATAHLSVFLRRLTQRMVAETLVDQSDRQLVEQFLARRDEAVFTALVHRHGPMVYRVCWRVLQQEQDAEDAFQATFLVLAQKLHTIRKQDSLASWLHGVAHRVALKARSQAAMRRRHEERASVSEFVPPNEVTWRELRSALDAELAQLPDKWRLPVILCYLEGRTQDEAAGHLGWSGTTLQRRLAEGRAALGRRLSRRGVVWPAALSAVLLSDCVAPAALAPGLIGSTVEGVACVAAGHAAISVVSAKVAALTEGVQKTMLLTKIQIATGALLVFAALVGGAGLIYQTQAGEPRKAVLAGKQREAALAPETWVVRATLEDQLPTSVAVSPDRKTLVTVGVEGLGGTDNFIGVVRVWDLVKREERRTLRGQKGALSAAAFAPNDSKLLATSAYDGTIRIWDLTKGAEKERITIQAHGDPVAWVAFAPDGKTLASASHDGSVKLWDLTTQKEKVTLKEKITLQGHKDKVISVAFSPDGKKLLTGAEDEGVKLWDVSTGKELLSLREPTKGETTHRETSVAFSPSGKVVAAASYDRTIKLWDAATGKELLTLKGHTSRIHALAFSPDGKMLASAGYRLADKKMHGVVKLWDIGTGKEWTTLATGMAVATSIAFASDGKSLAIGGGTQEKQPPGRADSGRVELWELDK